MTPLLDTTLSGRMIGNYRLEREIGRGGMGVVYLATHVALERSVALKLLLPELAQDSGVVARMLQEARCAAQITGHHVVRVIDVGQLETGQPFIVMEYVDGVDLARLLQRDGPPAPERAVCWVIEACVAIAEAHEKGIVHRDLKPENLLLAREEGGSSCIKVLDFGISKQLHRTGLRAVTRPHDLMGSPQYMAPEQIRTPLLVDARADVWALGTILIELLTGTAAFPGQTVMEVWAGVLEAEPHLPDERVATWPAGLASVARKAVQKLVEERYQSVQELVSALAPYAPPEAQPALAALQRRAARASGANAAEPATPGPAMAAAVPALPAAVPASGRVRRALLVLLCAVGLLAVAVQLQPEQQQQPPLASPVALPQPPEPEASAEPPPVGPRAPEPPRALPQFPERQQQPPQQTVRRAPRAEPPERREPPSAPQQPAPPPSPAPDLPPSAWDLTTFGGRL